MKRHSTINAQTPRGGFVLVLTLAMILIAVTITARTASRSLSRTLQSMESEAQLRNRWGTHSLQQSLLPRSVRIFQSVESEDRPQSSPIWLDGQVQLSGTTFQLRLSDENAKINLNTLRRIHSTDSFRRTLSDVVSNPGRVVTRDEQSLAGRQPPFVPFESWGQVFEDTPPTQLIDLTTAVTCWGNGRLNLMNAPDKSVRLLLEPVIGPSAVDAILRQRRELSDRRDRSIPETHPSLIPAHAAALVTEKSHCFSLWMICEETGQMELRVQDSQDNRKMSFSFRW